MLKDDLSKVAIELIKEFGSKGKLLTKGGDFDILTGDEAPSTENDIDYFYEDYGTKELVDGHILAGDAKLYTYSEVLPNQQFKDDTGQVWNIIGNEIEKLWLQGKVVCYVSHIRK